MKIYMIIVSIKKKWLLLLENENDKGIYINSYWLTYTLKDEFHMLIEKTFICSCFIIVIAIS